MEALPINISQVGRGGQIAIPRAIRQALNLQEGDRIAFVRRGNEMLLQPLQRTLHDFRGSIPVSQPQDFEAIRLAINAAWMVRQQVSTAYTFDRKHFSRFDSIAVKTPGENG